MAKFKPYTIVTPPFDPTSGGIRVMWGLYGWLLSKGQIVYPNASYEDPNFIAIYAEIYHGNPTNANTVVRYILNKPGVMSSNGTPGPTSFEKDDKLFVFSDAFNTVGADEEHLMFLPILNLHIFKDQGKKRNKSAVFFGKYNKAANLNVHYSHPNDAVKIDRKLALDQSGLADLLNECEVLYGYDSMSAMYEIARLCGCRVVLIPDGSYTKEQFGKYEPGMNGISWDHKEHVVLDTVGFRNHYKGMIRLFDNKMDRFIELTQK